MCLATHTASSFRVGFDAASVRAVQDLGVLKGNSIHSVIALATDGSNAQTVTTRAVQVVNGDLSSAGDSNAVILVIDGYVLQSNVVTRRDVEAIAVVSSCVFAASIIRLVACRVIQSQARNGQMLYTGDLEAVNWPVLDIEVGDLGVIHVLYNNEMVRPRVID